MCRKAIFVSLILLLSACSPDSAHKNWDDVHYNGNVTTGDML